MTTRRWFILGSATLSAGSLLCTGCDPSSGETAAELETQKPATLAVVPTETPTARPRPTDMPTATQPARATLTPIAKPESKTACPFGLENDPAPGRCRRYVDKNKNGFCDWSEPA